MLACLHDPCYSTLVGPIKGDKFEATFAKQRVHWLEIRSGRKFLEEWSISVLFEISREGDRRALKLPIMKVSQTGGIGSRELDSSS